MIDIHEYLKQEEYKSFLPIYNKKIKAIKEHVFLQYDEVMSEIDKMNIPINIQMAAEDEIELNCTIIDLIQGYKDRLTDLYCKAERDFDMIEGTYESFVKMWIGVFSKLSSDKKREGEAEVLFSFLDEQRRIRKEIFMTVKNHLKNMSDKFFSVSRKASIHEHVYKLVGTGYIDQPDAFDKALKDRRPRINEKMEKLRHRIADGAKGWDAVPNEEEIQ